MKKLTVILLALLAATCLHAQEQKEKSPEELASDMVSKMESHLNLMPDQTFYVDSILFHDYKCWMDEIDGLQQSGVQESSVYMSVKNKWDAHIDSALVKVLTPEQFTAYQKMMGKYKKPKKTK